MTMRDQLITKKSERLSEEQTKGGPHDKEFFRCFVTYLDEALIQIQQENIEEKSLQTSGSSSEEEEEASNVSN